MKTLVPILIASLVVTQANAEEPPADGRDRIAEQRDAMNNMRQLFLALFEFDVKWGSYPDDDTAIMLKDSTGTKVPLKGNSANVYFRQLLVSDLVKSERIFQIGEITADDAALLGKGECQFAYVKGLNSAGSSATPVVFAPMVPGQLKFDPKVLDGRAIMLRLDGSASSHPINADGEVLIDGRSLFDPEQPFWRGKRPQVALPE